MQNTLVILGKIYMKNHNLDPISSLLENPETYYYIRIVLEVDTNDSSINSYSIQHGEYDHSKHRSMIYYRRPPPQGPGAVPSAKLTEPNRTLSNKIVGWFSRLEQHSSEDSSQPLFLLNSLSFLRQNSDLIIEDLVKLKKELTENYRVVRTEILRTENRRLPNNPSFILNIGYEPIQYQEQFLEYLRSILRPEVRRRYSRRYGRISEGNAPCFYCGETKLVHGFASPFTFYTHDKMVFSPELNVERAWSLFPVCTECAIYAENGRFFIEETLNFRLHGVRYYLIPQALKAEDLERLVERLRRIHGEKSSVKKTESTEVSIRRDITGEEDELLGELKEEKNNLTLTFLFYQKNNAQEEILAFVPDVLPSRLAKLHEVKEKIDENPIFASIWKALPKPDFLSSELNFSFGNIRELFPKAPPGETAGQKDTYVNDFLTLVKAALDSSPVEEAFLIFQMARMLQAVFSQRAGDSSWYLNFSRFAFNYLLVREFYSKIGCLRVFNNSTKGESMKSCEKLTSQLNTRESPLVSSILSFLNESSYFDHPVKRGAFLIGFLTHKVAQAQYRSLGSEPFYERLNSLRMHPRLIHRLLPDIIAKLQEYGKNYADFKTLEALASCYLAKEAEPFSISNDDLSFSFATGLAMGNAFYTGENQENEEE